MSDGLDDPRRREPQGAAPPGRAPLRPYLAPLGAPPPGWALHTPLPWDRPSRHRYWVVPLLVSAALPVVGLVAVAAFALASLDGACDEPEDFAQARLDRTHRFLTQAPPSVRVVERGHRCMDGLANAFVRYEPGLPPDTLRDFYGAQGSADGWTLQPSLAPGEAVCGSVTPEGSSCERALVLFREEAAYGGEGDQHPYERFLVVESYELADGTTGFTVELRGLAGQPPEPHMS